MSVNWNAGNMRWWPHTDANGQSFPLPHLHPFQFEYTMPADKGLPERTVTIQVGFAMHCFTRDCQPDDPESEFYRDEREVRTFDYGRYALSKHLKQIAQTLDERRCEFAKSDNYLTVDLVDHEGRTVRYGVFFNIKKLAGRPELLLVIQSAYELNVEKPLPRIGKIGFRALVGHALRGTKPKRP